MKLTSAFSSGITASVTAPELTARVNDFRMTKNASSTRESVNESPSTCRMQ